MFEQLFTNNKKIFKQYYRIISNMITICMEII